MNRFLEAPGGARLNTKERETDQVSEKKKTPRKSGGKTQHKPPKEQLSGKQKKTELARK